MAQFNAIARAVKSLACESVTLKKPKQGAYDEHGRWQPQEDVTTTFLASVQVVKGDELMRLPENRRTREAIKVFSLTELETVSVKDHGQANIIEWKGNEYEVDLVEDWMSDGGYWMAMATKKGQ